MLLFASCGHYGYHLLDSRTEEGSDDRDMQKEVLRQIDRVSLANKREEIENAVSPGGAVVVSFHP